MNKLNRTQYAKRILILYVIFFIISMIFIPTENPFSLDNYKNVGLGIFILPIMGLAQFLIPILIILFILTIIISPFNIFFLRKRLYDTGISKWWSTLALIPIIGQIFSIIMIFPESYPGNQTIE